MKRIAIVAVHGVIPHLEHDFQDSVATALRDRLNDEARTPPAAAAVPEAAPGGVARARGVRGPNRDGTGAARGSDDEPAWTMDVVFPKIPMSKIGDPVAATRASIVRVHDSRDKDATKPTGDYYDVIEAYWSPIDKGKTNVTSVLLWLLQVVLNPINTTARYGGSAAKARSDVLSVLAFLVVGLLAFAVVLIAFGNALALTLAHINPPPGGPPHTGLWLTLWNYVVTGWSRLWSSLALLWNPTLGNIKALLSPAVLLRLALGIAGAYAAAQAVRASISIGSQWKALSTIPVQRRSRIVATAVLALAALALMAACAFLPFDGTKRLGTVALWLVFSALVFEFGKTMTATFVTNFFGDVQIYCTHDANSTFYELRQKILDLVTRTIVETLEADPAYDRVYIFAHSLGSTISLDALMRIYNLRSEGGVTPDQWNRIRGFVTFGTSLEKTRYFLDAYNPSFSASFAEWRDDYYGVLFDPDPSVLERPNGATEGIYWGNYWFFNDFIADRITTYRSFLKPDNEISSSSFIRRQIRAELKSRGGDGAEPVPIAQNRASFRLPVPLAHPILHGDYLGSDWFWTSNSEATPSWWARLLGGTPPPDANDRAIDVLRIVTSHRREETGARFAEAKAGAVPRRSYTDLDAAKTRASPLTDVIMP
jgi:hypothetical protein